MADPADRPFAVERLYAHEGRRRATRRRRPPRSHSDARRSASRDRAARRAAAQTAATGKGGRARRGRARGPGRGGRRERRGDRSGAARGIHRRAVAVDDRGLRRVRDRSIAALLETVGRGRRGRCRRRQGLVQQGRPRAHRVRTGGEAERQARGDPARRTLHRSISPPALGRLVDAAGDDINKLRDDIGRLVLFGGNRTALTADDVDAVTSGDGVVDDWGVVNAIGEGDAARALVEVGRRMDRGDSPHAIVGQLRWWVSNRLVEGAPERAKPAIDAVLRTDRALKSSGGEERVLLERLVVELTGKRLPPSRGWGAR